MQLVRLTLFTLLGSVLGYLLASRTDVLSLMELQDWLLLVGIPAMLASVYLSLRKK